MSVLTCFWTRDLLWSSTQWRGTAPPPSAWIRRSRWGNGLVSGYGTIDGRLVAVYSQDFTVYGGSLSQVNGEKIVKVQKFALNERGAPVIGIK